MAETVPLSVLPKHLAFRYNWVNGHYVGPGVSIPPRKEDCDCRCAEVDELGRPAFIGFCPDSDCQRRPR